MRILVTGAATGIGRATAIELTKRGHEVVATARRVDALDDLDVAVTRRWTEYPGASACFALRDPAHASLCAAVARYKRNRTVRDPRNVCTCGEIAEGHAALIGLAQLQRQAHEAAGTIPALAGPWPHYLDPSGVLGRAAPPHPLYAKTINRSDVK
mgnify:CR=1 FL=1